MRRRRARNQALHGYVEFARRHRHAHAHSYSVEVNHYSLLTQRAEAELQKGASLGTISQFEYIFICGLGLQALRQPTSTETWKSVLQRAQGLDSSMLLKIKQRSAEAGRHMVCEDVVYLMIVCKDLFREEAGRRNDFKSRNHHPASIMMDIATGSVVHTQKNFDVLSAGDPQQPGALLHCSSQFLAKFAEVVEAGAELEFFQTAFVSTEPCFEAKISNALAFECSSSRAGDLWCGIHYPVWDDRAGGVFENVLYSILPTWMELQSRKFVAASSPAPIDFGSEQWKGTDGPATIARRDFIQSCLTREAALLFLAELSPRIPQLQSPANSTSIEAAISEFLQTYAS